jgi:hypothetical protein
MDRQRIDGLKEKQRFEEERRRIVSESLKHGKQARNRIVFKDDDEEVFTSFLFISIKLFQEGALNVDERFKVDEKFDEQVTLSNCLTSLFSRTQSQRNSQSSPKC